MIPDWRLMARLELPKEEPQMLVWDQMNAARKHFFSLWIACSIVAITCAVAAFSGVEALRWGAVVFCLLAAHAMTAWLAMQRMANLQAALDMKRIALDNRRGQKMRLIAGDEVDLFGHALIRFNNSVTIEIIR